MITKVKKQEKIAVFSLESKLPSLEFPLKERGALVESEFEMDPKMLLVKFLEKGNVGLEETGRLAV